MWSSALRSHVSLSRHLPSFLYYIIRPVCVAAGQEAHVLRSGVGHGLDCHPGFRDSDGLPVNEHHRRSLRAVCRQQQRRRKEDDFVRHLFRRLPSAAGRDHFLLFSHCIHITLQGNNNSYVVSIANQRRI